MALLRGPLPPYYLTRGEPDMNRLKEERGEEGRGGEERKENKVMVTLLLSTGLCTLPYPCISEMLIKGRFPEEPSARSGPACSARLSWVICKKVITAPQGSEFRLKSSLRFCACSSLRRQCCSHPGTRALALLGNQAPRLWVKLRCRIS